MKKYVTKLPKCGAKAKSTGKRTEEGKKRVGQVARSRLMTHGRYTKQAAAAKKQMRERLAALKTEKEV
jgi:hypothetical protein